MFERSELSQCCLSFEFPFQSSKLFVFYIDESKRKTIFLFVFNVPLVSSSMAILLALNIKTNTRDTSFDVGTERTEANCLSRVGS